uniref:hypothetical protein n=1 Tax=Aneurinibacillus terranovensis TaxID=278991 RepID=UPI00054FFF1D
VLAVDGNSPMSQTVTLGAGQQQTLTFSFSIPLQNTVHLQATINPNHDNPSDETTYTDNAKDISVPAVVKKPVRPPVSTPGAYDLAAEIPVGQSNLRFVKTTPIDCIVKNGGFYVYDKDGNAIEIPITCNVKITVSYPGYKQEFVRTVTSMKPGKLVHLEVPTPDYKAFGTSYKSPYPENAYLDIQVKEEVNYDDAVDEENHGNNVANGTVRVYWSKTKLQPKK